MSELRVRVLGSGTSFGVPVIGCDCAVCRSSDARNRRLRVSVWVRWQQYSVLIDSSPDLRQQALTHDIRRIDALLLTHAHADHLHGLDDVRVYCGRQQQRIRCLGTRHTLQRAAKVFDYAFARNDQLPLGAIPQLQPEPLRGRSHPLFGLELRPIQLPHGRTVTTAFRFGDGFAYVTDASDIPPRKIQALRGLDTLILDCLRHEPHATHLHLERSLELAERIGARVTYLTHIGHELDHATTEAELPAEVRLAYDGLELRVPG